MHKPVPGYMKRAHVLLQLHQTSDAPVMEMLHAIHTAWQLSAGFPQPENIRDTQVGWVHADSFKLCRVWCFLVTTELIS